MSYRFRVDAPIRKSVVRVLEDQVARAGREFALAGAIGVHEGRKSLKRIRALLRLIRPAIGEKAFRSNNAAMRDIASELSGMRDHTILREALTKLESRYGSEARDCLKPLAVRLEGKIDPESVVPVDLRFRLERAGARLGKLKVKGRGFAPIAQGLRDSYRHGRRTLKLAAAKPSDEAFHELRKAVQWHWRQMTLLSRAWPRYFDVRIEAARELSQILGDDHDLSVLIAYAQGAATDYQLDIAAIETLCKRRQDELRREAAHRARRLFAEKPSAFAARMGSYWKAAKHLKTREAAARDDVHEPECARPCPASSAPKLPVKSGSEPASQRRD